MLDLTKLLQRFVDGAALVTFGRPGVQKNRNLATAAAVYAEATNTAKWTVAVSSITVTPVAYPALVIFGAVNESTAGLDFANPGGMSVDVSYDYIPAGQPYTRQFAKGTNMKRVDVLPIGGTSRVVIAGVEEA